MSRTLVPSELSIQQPPPPPSLLLRLSAVGATDREPFADLTARIAGRSAIVAVIGLGYVGLPLLLAAAEEGFVLIGVDTDGAKVQSLREGRSHVVDVSKEELCSAVAQFTTDHRALTVADVIVVSVPTPLRDGAPDLSLVEAAAVGAELAAARRSNQEHPGSASGARRQVGP